MVAGTPTRSDMYILGTNTNFQNRVQAALALACSNIASEGWSVPFHRERAAFVNTILTPANFPSYVQQFSISAGVNGTVVGDATQASTNYTALTAANVAAQQAFVTDTDLDNAIAAIFNAYVREPA